MKNSLTVEIKENTENWCIEKPNYTWNDPKLLEKELKEPDRMLQLFDKT